MKAIVMAGGEGTRLRPLTSNQPKPMVPIVGKPCMEHILELLKAHGLEDVIVTVAFLPQAIRSYFGDGESLGLNISYSVEETPLGTAGSVRLATRRLDEPVLVISGDALCDVDLTAMLTVHREKGAAVTIGLKSVDNPLEFGIVVTDEDGRIERFLEKPSWGQVFSDTINTGIYVLEPEVLRHIPDDQPYDFSKELFPLLLEMGRPLYGHVFDGYWQDIGNLEQYLQANFDALDGSVRLQLPGMRLRGNIWIGEGVDLHDLEAVHGPAFVGNYCRIAPEATVDSYSVLNASVTLRENARTARSVIDTGTHVGRAALIEGAIVGRSCDVRAHVRIGEGVAVGDEVTIGDESVLQPGVRIYPYKEIESGALIHESLIWESRVSSRLFDQWGVSGRVNVDLTPEAAVRLATALGTALRKGSRVVASRDSAAACRMIKRAIITGLTAAGVNVADLRVLAGGGQPAPAEGGGLRRRRPRDHAPDRSRGRADPVPRAARDPAHAGAPEGDREALLPRRAPARRVQRGRLDHVSGARARELRPGSARHAGPRGDPRAPASGSSSTTATPPLRSCSRSCSGRSASRRSRRTRSSPTATRATPRLDELLEQTKRIVAALGADLGVVFDRAAERLHLIDERAQEVPLDRALLLFLQLIGSNGKRGKLAFPVTVTSQVERLLEGSGLEIVRTPASLAELTKAAASDGFIFAGAVGGGYVFPEFLPGYDAVASLAKLLELLAPVERPLSELVAALPESTLVHRELHCPWALKGTVMRVLHERLEGRDLDVTDGIKVHDERGWAQVLPDADEPVVHVYAEGRNAEESEALEGELRSIVEEILAAEESAVGA